MSFGSTKKPHALTFARTCAQVVIRKQFIQAIGKLYIWWRDLIEGIGLSNLKQGLSKVKGQCAFLVLETLVSTTKDMISIGLICRTSITNQSGCKHLIFLISY